MCVAAAAFGLALATLVFPFAARFVFGLAMPKVTVAIGLALAVRRGAGECRDSGGARRPAAES